MSIRKEVEALLTDLVNKIPEEVKISDYTIKRSQIIGFSLIFGFIDFCAMLSHLAIRSEARQYGRALKKELARKG